MDFNIVERNLNTISLQFENTFEDTVCYIVERNLKTVAVWKTICGYIQRSYVDIIIVERNLKTVAVWINIWGC